MDPGASCCRQTASRGPIEVPIHSSKLEKATPKANVCVDGGQWLVHEDAREGADYALDHLLPFWNLTNEQDWEICRWQQKGVDSIGYAPGPLSQRKEYDVDAFIR